MKKKNPKNFLKRLPGGPDELLGTLFECYRMARRGKTNTDDQMKFEAFYVENLENLCEDILTRRYKPSRGKAFITHEPVMREIFAAPFRDRIVHHLLYAIVAPWWDKQFIYDSYSCRNEKGTDFAVERLQRAMRKVSRGGRVEATVIKGDLSGYFMSLNRKILYEKVMWGLKRQFPEGGFLYDLCAYLWKEIIFDDPTINVRIAGRWSDWDELPTNKSLFNQPDGQGIVIGNLTSQLLSNIMLNDFDWWMKCKMGFYYYGRYVDDFYIVVPKSEVRRAMKCMNNEIPAYLSEMGLTLHPNKKYVQDVKRGCPFLGKKVYLNAILPGKRYKRNFKKAMYKFVSTGIGVDTVVSYIGMGKNMKVAGLQHNLIEGLGGVDWR